MSVKGENKNRMRFGRLPKEETITSKALIQENKILEEKVSILRRVIEEDKKKSEVREKEKTGSQAAIKSFAIRDVRKVSRGTARDGADSGMKSNPQLKGLIVKKGIRAYEEVVKNKRNARKQDEIDQERKEAELVAILDSIGMLKFHDHLKSAGILTIDDLKDFDLKKLNLLPGFEIKLSKKLAEVLHKQLPPTTPVGREVVYTPQPPLPKPIVVASEQKELSEDEDYFKIKRPPPLPAPGYAVSGHRKPDRLRNILEKHRPLHEESTVSDLKPKTTDTTFRTMVGQVDTGCGTMDQSFTKPRLSCWYCAKQLLEGTTPTVHPIFENKSFCNVDCMRSLFKEVTANCRICRKVIIKPGGLLFGGAWCCSQVCMDKLQSEDCYNDRLEPGLADYKPAETVKDSLEQELQPEDEEDSEAGQVDLDFGELIN